MIDWSRVRDEEIPALEPRYLHLGRAIMRQLAQDDLVERVPPEVEVRRLRRQVESLTFETWLWGGLFFVALVLLLARGGRRS